MRGTLIMNWQLFDACGIFCGFSANLIFYWTDQLAWRFQIASACIPAGALIVLIWTIPESPRWLLKKGKGPEAFASLCELRHTPLQAATELFFANAQIQKELDYMRRRKPDPENTNQDHAPTQPSDATGVTNGGNTGPRMANGSAFPQREAETVTNVEDLGKVSTYHLAVRRTNYWSRIVQLLLNPRTRRATVAASVVMFGQQLCGV